MVSIIGYPFFHQTQRLRVVRPGHVIDDKTRESRRVTGVLSLVLLPSTIVCVISGAVCSLWFDDLHQFHQWGWVEKMHPDKPLGVRYSCGNAVSERLESCWMLKIIIRVIGGRLMPGKDSS